MTSATSCGHQRCDAGVDGVGALLVAVEPHQRELRLDRTRRNLGEPHRFSEQFAAQRAVQRALRVLGGGVAGPAVVGLERRDRGHRDDQAVARVDQLGQQRAGHPQRAQHVGLPHPAPVLQVGVGHGFEPLGAAGVVDQHVDPVQPPGQGGDRGVVCDVGHNGGAADLGGQRLDPVGPAGHRDHVKALCGKGFRGGLADAGAGAGDHGDTVVGVWSTHRPNSSKRAKFLPMFTGVHAAAHAGMCCCPVLRRA